MYVQQRPLHQISNHQISNVLKTKTFKHLAMKTYVTL